MKAGPPQTVDAYIASFPESTRALLMQMRTAIREEAPDAEEKMSYGIPTFRQNGNLVHYAAYQHHIGFYPGAAAIVDFADDFAQYKSAKGSVQFPIGEPLPLKLVKKVVRYRVKQDADKANKKAAASAKKGKK